MMTRAKFNRVIQRLVAAETGNATKHITAFNDIPRIERQLQLARKRYRDALDELFHELQQRRAE